MGAELAMLDIYEGTVWRPPSEARSLIIQATVGCSWNRCTFCPPYKDKEFRIKTVDEFKADVDRAFYFHRRNDRIFIADGNALCIPTDDLLQMLDYVYLKFKLLQRVSIYGGPLDVKEKTQEELDLLKKRGLKMVYLGLESGNAKVLRDVQKGATPEMMVEAARKLKEAHMWVSSIFILGLGGVGDSVDHAQDTARILNRMDPDYAAALSLMLEDGTDICKARDDGTFQPLDPVQTLEELRTIVDGLELTRCTFRANHASNYAPIGGKLPDDKADILEQIDAALEKGRFKPDGLRGL